MSHESFIRLLQEILTMLDPTDPRSVAQAHTALTALVDLAVTSNKADIFTVRTMRTALQVFDPHLVQHRDEFAGKPGDFHGNQAKRNRLSQALCPHC